LGWTNLCLHLALTQNTSGNLLETTDSIGHQFWPHLNFHLTFISMRHHHFSFFLRLKNIKVPTQTLHVAALLIGVNNILTWKWNLQICVIFRQVWEEASGVDFVELTEAEVKGSTSEFWAKVTAGLYSKFGVSCVDAIKIISQRTSVNEKKAILTLSCNDEVGQWPAKQNCKAVHEVSQEFTWVIPKIK